MTARSPLQAATSCVRDSRLEIRGVTKSFMVDGRPLHALDSIDLSITPGEFITVVGASGCGKSTLLRIIAGLETSHGGKVLHGGQVVDGPSLDRGIVFQEPRLFPWLTTAQNVGLGLAYHNHWWEFQSQIGEIEALYTQTDPDLVHFVLDAGHAYHGGADVPAFIRAHFQRIAGFHLRDYKDGHLSTLGTGTFPLAQVAATIKQVEWTGWVENEEEREDQSKNGADVVAPAFKAMKEAFAS